MTAKTGKELQLPVRPMYPDCCYLFPAEGRRRLIGNIVVYRVDKAECRDPLDYRVEHDDIQMCKPCGHHILGNNRAEDDRTVSFVCGTGKVYR